MIGLGVRVSGGTLEILDLPGRSRSRLRAHR